MKTIVFHPKSITSLFLLCIVLSHLFAGCSEDDRDTTPPSTPGDLQLTRQDGCVLLLTWAHNTDDDLDGYNIYRREGDVGDFTSIEENYPDTSHVDQELECERIYYYRLTAVDAAGNESEPTDEIGETTENYIPAIPLGLQITALDGCRLFLEWQPNQEEDLEGYNLYRREGSPGNYSLIEEEVQDASYTDENLECDQLYYYQITATDVLGSESNPTNPVSETTVNFMPARPESLRIVAHNWPEFDELYVMVLWYPNSEDDLAGYEISRGEALYSIALYDTSATNFFKDTEVEIGQRYYYQVNAFDELGLRGTMTDAEYDTPLVAPTLLSPAEGELITEYPPTFTWEDVTGEENYRVMIGTSKVDIAGVWSVEVDQNQTSATYTGLDQLSGDYCWAVATVTNSTTDWNSLSEIRLFTVE